MFLYHQCTYVILYLLLKYISYQILEHSNTASNRNTTLQELQADDKGKQIVVEENESEATNEEEDSTPMEINAEPGEQNMIFIIVLFDVMSQMCICLVL